MKESLGKGGNEGKGKWVKEGKDPERKENREDPAVQTHHIEGVRIEEITPAFSIEKQGFCPYCKRCHCPMCRGAQ